MSIWLNQKKFEGFQKQKSIEEKVTEKNNEDQWKQKNIEELMIHWDNEESRKLLEHEEQLNLTKWGEVVTKACEAIVTEETWEVIDVQGDIQQKKFEKRLKPEYQLEQETSVKWMEERKFEEQN